MNSIDYTKGKLFSKKPQYTSGNLNLNDIGRQKQFVKKLARTGNTVTFAITVPDVPVDYFESQYGSCCIRCGADFSRTTALRAGVQELCNNCEKALERQLLPKDSRATLTINGQVVYQVKAVKAVDSMLPYKLTRVNCAKGVGVSSLSAYLERVHDVYVSWVRKQGLTTHMNIVRKPK